MSVSSRISRKPQVQISQNVLYILGLHVTVARSSSDGNPIGYVMYVQFCGYVIFAHNGAKRPKNYIYALAYVRRFRPISL